MCTSGLCNPGLSPCCWGQEQKNSPWYPTISCTRKLLATAEAGSCGSEAFKATNEKLGPHLRRGARIGTEQPWTAVAGAEVQIISQYPPHPATNDPGGQRLASGRRTHKAEQGSGGAKMQGTGQSSLTVSETVQ